MDCHTYPSLRFFALASCLFAACVVSSLLELEFYFVYRVRPVTRALTSAPLLAHPEPQRQWTVQTDASGYAIGAVLSQQQDDGTQRPVAFWSRKLNSAERNYSATERELMALVKACEHWRAYLHGSPHPILLRSDHKPLVYLNGKAELGLRLSRWMEELCDLTFQIGYVKGKDNAAADALSRRADYEASAAAPAAAVRKVKLLAASVRQPVASRWRVGSEWMQSGSETLMAVTRRAPLSGRQAPIAPTSTPTPTPTSTQTSAPTSAPDIRGEGDDAGGGEPAGRCEGSGQG